MKKVCMLFGAGADAPYGIATSGDFLKTVLGANDADTRKMNDAIKEHYRGIVPLNDKWYPPYRKHTWKEDDLIKAALRRKNLENRNKVSDKNFNAEFSRIKDDYFEKEHLINQYPSYMGIIDGKFSSLIDPSILGSGRFWQVVSCYCRAYLAIMKEILESDDYLEFLKPTKDLIDVVRKTSRSKADKDAYYSVLKELKPHLGLSVVTTNYTFFCEEIAGLNESEIAYVHGRIGLYESPRDLYVYDAETEQFENEVVFPYLFIQSGVKPIVESRQIKEYAKMINFMEAAEKIIILGYRLNYDDNHINSIIRTKAIEGKQITYLSFGSEPGKADSRSIVFRKLKLADDIPNFTWKEITSGNAKDVFENELLS